MDSSDKSLTGDVGGEDSQCTQPSVQISFHVTLAEESSNLTLQEMRDSVREYSQAITRVDASLVTLKNQLMNMREQDLQVLKQLIQIGDTIRRLTRSRAGGKHSTRRSTHELMTSAVDVSVTLRRFKGKRSGSFFAAGDYSTVPLVRRQSEPQVCTLSPRADPSRGEVRSWGSRRGSASSNEWWSEDTMGSSEDGLDTFESDEDLLNAKDSIPSNITATAATTTTTNITATTTTTTTDILRLTSGDTTTTADDTADDTAEATSVDATLETFVQRPKSHSVVAATFLNRPKLSGGNNAYSDILNQNVRLWKDRLEHAHSVRQKVSILEEESQE